MYNLNHDYSTHYDAMYERHENVGTHTCTTCHGDGIEEFSDCCGATILDDMICSDCLTECKIATDVCEDCNGSGEMEN